MVLGFEKSLLCRNRFLLRPSQLLRLKNARDDEGPTPLHHSSYGRGDDDNNYPGKGSAGGIRPLLLIAIHCVRGIFKLFYRHSRFRHKERTRKLFGGDVRCPPNNDSHLTIAAAAHTAQNVGCWVSSSDRLVFLHTQVRNMIRETNAANEGI